MTSRKAELVEAAYAYVLEHGLTDLSLRPVAEAIGSSTGVLRFLFGSREGLIETLLDRARQDEIDMLSALPPGADLLTTADAIWTWLAAPSRRALLRLWVQTYSASLHPDSGPWAEFARRSVTDWLGLLSRAQPPELREAASGLAQRTAVLSLLRGSVLDLVATGDTARTTESVKRGLVALTRPQGPGAVRRLGPLSPVGGD